MNEEQIEYYRKAYVDGSVPDKDNPLSLFSLTSVKLLTAIIRKEFNPVSLAARELAERGLSPEGKWVGFARAEQMRRQLLHPARKSKGKRL